MMTSEYSISNPEADSNDRSRESKRKRRRKIGPEDSLGQPENIADPSRWRSESEERIYATKLVDELSKVRPAPSSPVSGGRAVRETADRVLAVAAKGRSRWGRAILTGRLSFRLSQINKRHRHMKTKVTGDNRLKKPVSKKRLPPLQRKVKVLGRLVPGCQKISFPSLLEEATDYIAALQMQVRAMTVLSELLGGGGGGGNGNASASGGSNQS
ncbi:transcription factor bHLH149 [Coffea arabica]|uniref:Transcription factor bHLH149-like n=1 Tax=Coffea arabica TaxID=13443 RepID=A0A6P6VZE3_COFAR|nr:transcription factor bHLH149-like [Coffea arabica]XP_027107971.1 transcription factor bHLH149-like [Coffea arabica]